MSTSKHVLVDNKTYTVRSVRQGGMGRVWLLEQAFDDPFDPIYRRRIAVKTFDFMEDQRAVERELNVWISLDHQAILPLKKIGRLDYRLAAIMPLLEGSLEDTLGTRGSLNESEVSKILLAIAEGLDYAWSTFGILHLDLKPSNVLLESTSPPRIRIADWGISRLVVQPHTSHARVGSRVPTPVRDRRTAYAAGTPLFMAPERFSGDWVLSPTADVYSLGLMAIELSTGVLPFRFGEVDPVEEILSYSYLENARATLQDRGEAFRALCLRCVHPDPKARPNSYNDLTAALKLLVRKGGK